MTGSGNVRSNERPRRVAVGDGARRALPDADYADAFRVEAESLLPAATRTRLAFGALPAAVNRAVVAPAHRRVAPVVLERGRRAMDSQT